MNEESLPQVLRHFPLQGLTVERRVLFGRSDLFYNRLRIQPPLCVTMDQASTPIDVLDDVLTAVGKINQAHRDIPSFPEMYSSE